MLLLWIFENYFLCSNTALSEWKHPAKFYIWKSTVYKVIVSQKKESTLNHWNESLIISFWHQHETWTYCPPTCWSFHIGLNVNANSFFANRCRFWSGKNSVPPPPPITLYTKQHTALSGITGMMKWKWDELDQSQQISVTQRRGLEKWILVWELLSK